MLNAKFSYENILNSLQIACSYIHFKD